MAIPTYAKTMAPAIPGQILGVGPHKVLTRYAKAAMDFGAPVFGDGTNTKEVATTGGEEETPFVGVAGFNVNTAGQYEEGAPVNVVVEGMIYVIVGEAVKANSPAFVSKTTGKFMASVGGSAAVATNAIFLEDGASDGAIVPILLK